MTPNFEKSQSLIHSLLASKRSVSLLGLLILLMMLMVAMPARDVGALPAYEQRDILIASNADTKADSYLGGAVAASGDTVVVGAAGENSLTGAVYVYVRPTDGWTTSTGKTETARILPSALAEGDEFGESVAISGDTIVVGAPGDDGKTGAAYVFVRPAEGWANLNTYTARLAVSTREVNDLFGMSVAISGDTIVVGAPATNNGSKNGAAFVFTRPAEGWLSGTSYIALSDSSGEVDDDFGAAVATNADTVVVGAQLDDIGEADAEKANQGSAFIFVKPAGAWMDDNTPTSHLTVTGDNSAAGDQFGVSVAIHETGEAVAVGAENAVPPEVALSTVNGVTQGAAYVFMRPSSGWGATANEDAILSTAAGSASDKFGHSVSISGDTIVVGAHIYLDDAEQKGAAFVYVQPITGALDPSSYAPWVTTDSPAATLTGGSDVAEGGQFGEAVAVSGGTIVAGVPLDTVPPPGAAANGVDVVGPTNQGSAFVFMNGYCSAKSGLWHDPATWVTTGALPATADVCISTGHVVEMNAVPTTNGVNVDELVPEVRRLLVNPGGTLKLQTFDLQVNQEVINNGTLQQVEAQGAFGDAEILFIEGDGGSRYRGVNVDSAANLGAITVELRETIDWFSPTSEYEFCTNDGAASPPYAQRCYLVSPAAPALATITLWGLKDELNGIAVADLGVFHYNGSGWDKLTPVDHSSGEFSGYEYAKGDTSVFSPFLLGDTRDALGPTAVTLIAIGGGQVVEVPLLLLASVALLALASLGLLVYLRRKRA